MKIFNKKNKLQYEFLPDALEIAETPPSPLGRLIIWLIVVLFVITILWAYFGKIDEVAVARGKVIPDGRLKVIQAIEEGIVTAIHVSEGQKVKEGLILMEFDSSFKEIDIETLKKTIETLRLERDLLEQSLFGGIIQDIVSQSSLPLNEKNNLLQLIQSKEAEFQSKEMSMTHIMMQSELELSIAESEFEKLENNLALLEEKEQELKDNLDNGVGVENTNLTKIEKSIEILTNDENTYKTLYEEGLISKKEWEDKYNQVLLAEIEHNTQKERVKQEKNALEQGWKNVKNSLEQTEYEVQTQKLKVSKAKSKLNEVLSDLERLNKEREAYILELVVEKEKRLAELEASLTKAKNSLNFQTLKSPVNGIVLELASNTIGGVVSSAEPIMTIVPEETSLIVEASLLNKDIGFVTVGQEVSLKFDTFPFQKYGKVKGIVKSISPDALKDEGTGENYKMKIELDKTILSINGEDVMITPGMTVTAEIKTGQRRIIEFFLDPIIKYSDESLKVR